jgi:hypothetical protein
MALNCSFLFIAGLILKNALDARDEAKKVRSLHINFDNSMLI